MTFTAIKPSDASTLASPIHENTEGEVRALIAKAEEQAHTLANLSPAKSNALLRAIADAIESQRAALIESACAETALPEARYGAEKRRTTFQFKLFFLYTLFLKSQSNLVPSRNKPRLPKD